MAKRKSKHQKKRQAQANHDQSTKSAKRAVDSSKTSTAGTRVSNVATSMESQLDAARAAFANAAWDEVIKLSARVQPRLSTLTEVDQRSWSKMAAEAHFRQALDYLGRERQRAVVAALEKAVAWSPQDATYRFHLGLAHHRLQHFKDAYSFYEAAWQLDPSWRIAYHQALAAVQANEMVTDEEWTQLQQRLVQMHPKNAQGKAAVGRLIEWHQQQTKASDVPTAATPIAATEFHWQQRRNLPASIQVESGLVYLANGDHKSATVAFTKALKLGANSATPSDQLTGHQYTVASFGAVLLHYLGKQWAKRPPFYESGVHEETAATSEQVLMEAESRRFAVWALWSAGWHLYQKGQLVDAIKVWRGLSACGVNAEMQQNIALAAEQAAEYETAVDAWTEYVELLKKQRTSSKADREWVELLSLQVYLHLCRLGMRADVHNMINPAWFEAALKSRQLETPERLEMAEMLAALEDEELVGRALQPLRGQTNSDPEIARRVARIYVQANMSEAASAAWKSLHKLKPDDTEAARAISIERRNEALKMLKEGKRKLADAQQLLDQALELNSEDLQAKVGLAVCQFIADGDQKGLTRAIRQLATEKSLECYLNIAFALLQSGLTGQAATYFAKVKKVDSSPVLDIHIGMAYFLADCEIEGLKHFKQAFRAYGYDPDECMEPLGFLVGLEQKAAVDELAQLLYKYNPADPEVCMALGFNMFRLGDLTKAKQYISEAKKFARATRDHDMISEIAEIEMILEIASHEGLGEMFNMDNFDEDWFDEIFEPKQRRRR